MQQLRERGFFQGKEKLQNAALAVEAFNALKQGYMSETNRLENESGIHQLFLDFVQDQNGFIPFEVNYQKRRDIVDRIHHNVDIEYKNTWLVGYEDGTGLIYHVNENGIQTPDAAIPGSENFVGYKQVCDSNSSYLVENSEGQYPYPGVFFYVLKLREDTLELDDLLPLVHTIDTSGMDDRRRDQLQNLQNLATLLKDQRDILDNAASVRFQSRMKQVLSATTPYINVWDRLIKSPYLLIEEHLLVDRTTGNIRVLPDNEEKPTKFEYTSGYFKEWLPTLTGRAYIEAADVVESAIADSVWLGKRLSS